MKRAKQAGYLSLTATSLELFSQGDLKQIHLATLEVLEQTGIYLESMEAVDILCKAGATAKGNIVKIPEYLVEEAIRTSQGSLFMAGREEKYDIMFQKGRTHFTPFSISPYIDDPETGEYRYSTRKDQSKAVRLVDALDQYGMSAAMLALSDVDPEVENFYLFESQITNSSKPMDAPSMPKDKFELLVEMSIAVAGSPEAALINVGVAKLAQMYNLPSYVAGT